MLLKMKKNNNKKGTLFDFLNNNKFIAFQLFYDPLQFVV